MSRAADAIAIVLAGGRSRRLASAGLPAGGKAALTLDGRTFLHRIVSVLAAEVERVLVVAAAGQPLPPLPAGVAIVRDREPGGGPLAGIRDGLVAARCLPAGTAVICACDVPLMNCGVVRMLVNRRRETRASWVVPQVAGHPQVLLSALAVELLPCIEAYLATGRRDPRGLLAAVAVDPDVRVVAVTEAELAAVDPQHDALRDIDTPADLAWLERREIPPSSP